MSGKPQKEDTMPVTRRELRATLSGTLIAAMLPAEASA
jgi:hypothetical protein